MYSQIDSNLIYYLSVHINIDVVYFKINYENGLIYILTHMKVKNNKIKCYLT